MALANYSDLQDAVAGWLERSDLTERIPDFITLAESRLSRLLDIRVMEFDMAVTGVPGSRFIDLPDGFREAKKLWIVRDWGRDEKRNVLASEIATSTVQGEPFYWTVDGTYIAFERPCDQAYNFQIRMLIGLDASQTSATTLLLALNASQPANYVLTNYPDLYLFGALLEAANFLQDDNMAQRFMGRFENALQEARTKENRGKALAPLRTELSAFIGRRTFDIRRGY